MLSYVKRVVRPGSMHETGCSGLVCWDDPEGRDGKGGGRGVQDGMFRMGVQDVLHVQQMYTHG